MARTIATHVSFWQTWIASRKLIPLRRRILSVYLLHHAARRNGLDRFWRIAEVKEKYRERKKRRERQHLANEKFYASTRTKKPAGTSLPSQLVASRSEISPLLDSRCCFLHTGNFPTNFQTRKILVSPNRRYARKCLRMRTLFIKDAAYLQFRSTYSWITSLLGSKRFLGNFLYSSRFD